MQQLLALFVLLERSDQLVKVLDFVKVNLVISLARGLGSLRSLGRPACVASRFFQFVANGFQHIQVVGPLATFDGFVQRVGVAHFEIAFVF